MQYKPTGIKLSPDFYQNTSNVRVNIYIHSYQMSSLYDTSVLHHNFTICSEVMKQVDTWNASYFINQSISILTSAMPKLPCVKCQVDINNKSAMIKMYQKLKVMQWKINLATSLA